MPTLTLKKVPQDLCARLKKSAKRHRRSINQEAILCLELLFPRPIDVEAELEEIRKVRESIPALNLTDKDIEEAIHWGRQ